MILSSFSNIKENIKSIKIDKYKNDLIKSLTLNYNSYDIIIFASGDCCSFSWIEEYSDYYKFDYLIDNNIKSIEEIKIDTELPFSNIQQYDNNHLFAIKFKNTKEIFKFYLRNSSNGYYDGSLCITIEKK